MKLRKMFLEMSKTFNFFMTGFVVVFLFFANHSTAKAETLGLIKSKWCFGGGTTSWSKFNRGGTEDIHCEKASTGQHWVLVSNGKGNLKRPKDISDLGGSIKSGWCQGGITSWSDFNNDKHKLEDLHCDDPATGNSMVLLSDGKGNLKKPPAIDDPDGTIVTGWCKDPGITSWSDFDGDGKEDLHCDNNVTGSHWIMLSKGKGVMTPLPYSGDKVGSMNASWCYNGGITSWSDFDGDGKEDMHCDKKSTGRHWVVISDGTGGITPPTSIPSDPGGLIKSDWCKFGITSWSDFDGDGKEDMHCDNAVNGNHSVLISDGTGIMSPPDIGVSLIKKNWCKGGITSWSDYDGDAKKLEDLHCENAGNHSVLISDGTGRFKLPDTGVSLLMSNWCKDGIVSWSDFNKDGLEDIHCDETNGNHSVLISDGKGNLNPLLAVLTPAQ